jgi:hypothetical protein
MLPELHRIASFRLNPIFFLYCLVHISSSWVNISLHTKNQRHTFPGSALKVCVVGGWVVVVVVVFKVNLVISFGFGQAEQYPEYLESRLRSTHSPRQEYGRNSENIRNIGNFD